MFDIGISGLVQGIGNPGGIESLIAAHPALFDFGQTLVGTVQNISNGSNGYILRDVEAINYLKFFVGTRFSNDTNHERPTDGIDSSLGFVFRSDGNNNLEIDCSCGLCELDNVFLSGQELPVQDDCAGTNCGGLGDLNLVNDNVTVNDIDRSGNLVAGTALFFDKNSQVIVVASTHAFVGQYRDSGRTKFSEFAAQQVGLVGSKIFLFGSFLLGHVIFRTPVDVYVTIGSIGDLAFVFGNNGDGSLSSRKPFLEGPDCFRSFVVFILQCLLDNFVAFHDIVGNSAFFQTFSQRGLLGFANETAHRE
mmetsp:Transcript_33545/g.79091  ORF Transcript_33545/g.79091 Transcript_33545/m.79091 type:complete len:306 (-) Transcript_33545:296-1213(-)